MAGRLKTGLMAYALALGLALSPVAAYAQDTAVQELRIRDGYIPLAYCLKKKPGISHYFLRVERVGMESDSFDNILIDSERIGTPGLAISGLKPGAPYKIFVKECNKDGDCTQEAGYRVRGAKTRE